MGQTHASGRRGATVAALRSVTPLAAGVLGAAIAAGLVGCDNPSSPSATEPPATAAATAAAVVPPAPAAPPEPLAPEIIVDRTNVDIGRNRIAAGEPGIVDKALVFLRGAPKVQGSQVDVVALRAAKPSTVASILDALQQAGASGAHVKSETRDGATQALPVALVRSVPDCTPVTWIGKAGTIDVWPAGGGGDRRVGRGLAGPDLTLGMEALHKATEGCESPSVAVGADDAMTWGLVFDLGMAAQHQTWTRTSAAVVVGEAVAGRKLTFPASRASQL